MEVILKRARVLLADDHRGVADALKDILSAEFDLVGAVSDGISLLNAAAQLDPDVIVADISMPKLDGFNALAQLRARRPNVKVVFITMHHEPAIVDMALEAGAFGFVLKHSAFGELIPAVRAALDGKTYLSAAITRKSAS
jgi:DNA-binding NarL/FixJ family response regulator